MTRATANRAKLISKLFAMSEDSNKKDKKLDLNKVEEPATEYSLEKKTYDSELHPVLVQLLEKSIKQAEAGQVIPHDEVMKRMKERFPFLK